MEDLIIEETQATPEVKLLTSGVFTLSGRSFPENSFEFYEPIKQWLIDYLSSGDNKSLEMNFKIIYLNSSSTMIFFELFDICEKYVDMVDITINWLYSVDNDSIEEFGEDIKEDFEALKINVKSYEE